ncbi:MAG: hydroxypyruvate isomerase [Betaproteobacteria bacterium]|jgi:hydroxypyruvate isomerase|nr:hydroxypyruvate isomerase [Betaproteobacteria bacterium]
MPKLAANVSMLFPQLDFLDRFAAARAAGFRAVEYQFPYEHDAAEVARRARDAGVEVVLHNLPLGGNPKIERGIACLPGREREFRDNVERGIEYAVAARCARLNCISGIAPADAQHLEVLVGNLRYAARKLGAAGLQLMLEPVSTRTVPGFILNRSQPALDVLNKVGEGNAFLQYDLFHMQIMEGDLAMTIERLLPRIGHMQIADVPARNEPGTGELNFDFLLRHIDRLGYSGWIGCEYNPRGDTVEGLKWARAYLS